MRRKMRTVEMMSRIGVRRKAPIQTGGPRVAVLLGLGALLLGGLSGCSEEEVVQETLLPAVSAVEVALVDLDDEIRASGDLAARSHTMIAAEVAGRVTELALDEGAAVTSGATVIEIDPERRQLDLDAARARLAQARANYRRERSQTLRIRKLREENIASLQQLEKADTALLLAQSALEAEKSAVGVAERALADASVSAPFDGVVARRLVQLGEFVQPGTVLFELVSMSPLEAVFSISELDSQRVRPGQIVEVRVDADRNRAFSGEVTFVAPTVDPATRTLRVKAVVDNSAGELRPGLFARMKLAVDRREGVLMVPEEAIHSARQRGFGLSHRRGRPSRAVDGRNRRAQRWPDRGARRDRGRRLGGRARPRRTRGRDDDRGAGARARSHDAPRRHDQRRPSMSLSDVAIDRPVLTWMLVLALATFGVLGFKRLGVDRYPDMEFPFVGVQVFMDGASPTTLEDEVIEPLEEAFATIEGVRHTYSEATHGAARVMMEFELGHDLDIAAQDVRDKLNARMDELPDDIEPPSVGKADYSQFPIVYAPITTDLSITETTEYIDRHLKPVAESIPGAAGAVLYGGRERNIRIWMDPAALRARKLSVSDVLAAIRREHVERSGGVVEGKTVEWAIKTSAEFETVDELAAMVVSWDGDAPIRPG